jgi:hypothetical protein
MYLLGHALAHFLGDVDAGSFRNLLVGVHAVSFGNLGALGDGDGVGNLVRYLAAHRSADVVALGNIAVGGRTLVVVVVAADLKKHPRLYI